MPLSLQTFATVPEADVALKTPGARYLAGGTLVVRAASEGDLSLGTFVRATEAGLGEIHVTGDQVSLGSSVTMAEIARHRDLAPIAKATRAVGGPAVRNMATVGGNLFAPAPYGDFTVALLALDAKVLLGEQEMSIDRFLAERDSLSSIVTRVCFRLPAASAFRFLKVSRVKPKGVSVLSIAAVIEQAADGSVSLARIALGCMADRAIRAKAAEVSLAGKVLNAEIIAEAVSVVQEGTSPITDPIASAWYRSEVLPVHFRRLLLA